MPGKIFSRTQTMWLMAGALAIITFCLYAPMLRHGFVSYDDADYITGNAHVTGGLTWRNFVWAFTSSDAANWHPLTWISHMVDCELFGVNPAGHHLMNLLFHIANTLLLFVLLNQLTGAIWRSLLVAALFAWHPLHVESVAWASERKDVLSAFFFFLTLIAYARFIDLSKVRSPKSKIFYALALILFACGLMSKPMVVTLPFVLLLLDFWPLQRFNHLTLQRLVVEKIPFFALSVVSCLITYRVQHSALWSAQSLTLHLRLANALMAYVRYLSKIFWPHDLALIYPYPHFWPSSAVAAAAGLLAMLTAIFILQAKKFPYLSAGWFWFLGMLVPTIGLVQAGVQSMADRYTYLPAIGIFFLVVWSANDLLAAHPQKIKIAALAGTAVLVGCLICASVQLNYWRNDLALFLHTVEVTQDNYAAEDSLGRVLEKIGQNDDAEKCYADAVRIEPDFSLAQFDLGMSLLAHGKSDDASNHLAMAVELSPQNAVMQFDFAAYLAQQGNPVQAAAHFRSALNDQPDFPEAQRRLDLLKTNSAALDIPK